MKFENVLVTGAGGYLGSRVLSQLRGRCRVTGLDMKNPAGIEDFIEADITDLDAMRAAIEGRDAVIHIAALANIWAGGPQAIMAVNQMGTWNIAEASREAGVSRVVQCSSDSVVGFTVMSGNMLAPDYLPVDEFHTRRPTDPYALSKKLGEETMRSFVQRGAFEAVVLRPVFVLYPEIECEVIARAKAPDTYKDVTAGGPNPAGGGLVWHYVDPEDAARAFVLALEMDKIQDGFDTFFVSGPTNLAPEPTLERMKNRLGKLPELRDPELYRNNPNAPLYDLSRARDILGYVPQHDRRGLLYET